jgi:tetratricopeptide (TPR) repeat protein
MKRTLLALAAAGILTTAPISGEEASLPKPSQKWIELRSANFRLFSNAGRSATRQVAVDLEQLRAVLDELTDYNLQSPTPTLIYVFKGDRSFLPYKVLHGDRPAALTGYFISGDSANYIALNAAARDSSPIVYHEYVHYVSDNNMWNLPLWMSEGLAEFYESFRVDGDTVYIGLPLVRHLALLKGAVPIPLEQLFAVDSSSELFDESDRMGVYYAQSWALVHYLLLGNQERRQQLDVYLGMVRNGATQDQAFAASFSTDYGGLEAELRAYLRSLRLPWIETTTEIDLDREFEVRVMPYAEVLYRLGDLLASQQPERPERRTYFEVSARIDPEYGRSLSALAVEAEKMADWETASDLHERASNTSPDDPIVLFRWGEFMSRRGRDYRQAAAALTRSTELDPSFAPAWAALARVYADAGDDSEEAIEAARIASSMRPTDIMAANDLARLYLRSDRRKDAVVVIENALGSNRLVQAGAWTLVIEQDLRRARELLEEFHIDAATRRLDLAEEIVDRSLHPGVARLNIDSTRRMIIEHQAASLFNRAQELLSQGDREGARLLLTEALELTEESAVASSCRRLLTILDQPDRRRGEIVTTFNPSPTAEEINHYNNLIASKDFEGALEFLERIRNRVGFDQLRWVDERIREIQQSIAYNRFVDEYNRAVDFYNNKQFGEAVQALEELLTTLPEGREAESAKALLNDAREAQK